MFTYTTVTASIHDLFEQQVRKTPHSIAIEFDGECLTYKELNCRANQLAHYLQDIGVGPEILVGLCLERSLDMIVALFGILKAGGAYLPLDPSYPQARLNLMLEDAKISVLLTRSKHIAGLSIHQTKVVCLDTDQETITNCSRHQPESCIAPNNLAYVIYTSGSTGKPKGVMIEHSSLINFARAISRNYEITPSDRVLQFASLSFDVAVEEIFGTLSRGATLILRSDNMLRSIPAFLETCQTWNLTVLNIPTAFWHKICAEFPQVRIPDCVRLVVIGSERAIPRWLTIWKQHASEHIRLVNAYGPTEATVTSTTCDLAGPHALSTTDSHVLPIGKPIDNVQTFVFNQKLEPVSTGKSGELYIAGSGLARGYLNHPDLTAIKFIYKDFDDSAPIYLYKTGDLVRYRKDGHLEFLDRVDNQEKIRGFRVELHEIETILGQYPLVRETVVIAREDRPGDKRLVAYVVPNLSSTEELNSPAVEAEQLNHWQAIHDNDYFNKVVSHWEPTFNISGWLDSYTGQPIPDEAMREWLDKTVEQILSLRPQKVLEIGCGTGLVLFQVAPHCQTYVGTDFSKTALCYVQHNLQSLLLSHVTLEQRSAHNFQGIESQSFDTVILNSVIQYFPSVNYLMHVLENALEVLEPGGSIFIGDVRNYKLLPAFATSLELYQATDDLLTEELRRRVQKRLQHEEELTIDPEFFYALQHQYPQIQRVQIEVKKGRFVNELTQFRYDVILQVAPQASTTINPKCIDWQEQKLSVQALQQLLQEFKPQSLSIRNIPNGQIWSQVTMAQWLLRSDCPKTVGELRQTIQKIDNASIDPQQLSQLSNEMNYEIAISWSTSNIGADDQVGDDAQESYYDVTLQHRSMIAGRIGAQSIQLSPSKSWHAYTNDPLRGKLNQSLVPQLRSYLKEKLPSYMVPTAFLLLDALPLTSNGKVDKQTLPAIGAERPALDEAFVEASTLLEKELTDLWSITLGILDIGINDNFFELGGDSLQTTQVISRVEDSYKVVVPLKDFFSMPTIAGLAHLIQRTSTQQSIGHMGLAQLQNEVILDCAIQPPKFSQSATPQNVFLTGATGFLGAFLLYELLQNTQFQIYCLVRAKTTAEAHHKLRTALERCSDFIPSSAYSRLVPVIGNLTQPLLGLSDKKFQDLATVIDVIYHSGASVNLLYPYTALQATNVVGTHEILKLASYNKTKPLHYISTLDVFESVASTGVRRIYEQDSIDRGRGVARGYAQSKWVAEQLITQAINRGLPACIYRPGMISGHSHLGYANTTDLISRFIKSLTQLQQAPTLDFMLDMTPVDYVSRAIFHLSMQSESFGKAFHLVNSQALPLETLVKELNANGYSIEQVSYLQWQDALTLKPNALSPLASLLTKAIVDNQHTCLELWLGGNDMFDCTNTYQGLHGYPINCPPANSKLVNTYLNYFIQSGFIEAAPTRLLAFSTQ